MNIGTPLSLPQTASGLNMDSTVDMHFYNSHMFQQIPQSYPFAPNVGHQEPSFAPSSFLHQDSGFETAEPAGNISPLNTMRLDRPDVQHRDSGFETDAADGMMMAPPVPSGEK